MTALRRWAMALGCLSVVATPACLPWARRAPERQEPWSWAEHDGRLLRYEVRGPEDGRPVVLVHGFGSSLDVWGPMLPSLGEDLRVLRLDLPGFGRSDHREGPQDIESLAAAVAAVMDAAKIDRATLIAHSMGCAVALALALEVPARVEQLVLIGPWVYESQVPWGLRAAREKGTGELMLALWYRDHLDLRFAMSFHDHERWVDQGLLDAAKRTLSLEGTRRAALETIRGLGFLEREPRYAQVAQRTLVVEGREDRIATVPFAEALVTQLPDASLEVVPWTGHFPMIEAADHVGTRIRGFLDGTP